jgi:hypothetical protein
MRKVQRDTPAPHKLLPLAAHFGRNWQLLLLHMSAVLINFITGELLNKYYIHQQHNIEQTANCHGKHQKEEIRKKLKLTHVNHMKSLTTPPSPAPWLKRVLTKARASLPFELQTKPFSY